MCVCVCECVCVFHVNEISGVPCSNSVMMHVLFDHAKSVLRTFFYLAF